MLCRSVWYMILLVLGIVGVCYLSLHSEVSVFFEADVSPVASFVKHNGVERLKDIGLAAQVMIV